MKKDIMVIFVLILTIFSTSALDVGDSAEAIALPGLDGRFVLTSQIFKENWVILDFFATWCEPCKKELPELEELLLTLNNPKINGILLATDTEGAAIVKPFFADRPTPLKILIDRYSKTADRYGVEGLPTLFVVDPNQVIVFMQKGYSETLIEDLKAILPKE